MSVQIALPKKMTVEELSALHTTKGDLFKPLKEQNVTFDYALPQTWLDDLSSFCKKHCSNVSYHLILSTTVWVYPESAPFTVCSEVDKAIDLFSIALVNGWK